MARHKAAETGGGRYDCTRVDVDLRACAVLATHIITRADGTWNGAAACDSHIVDVIQQEEAASRSDRLAQAAYAAYIRGWEHTRLAWDHPLLDREAWREVAAAVVEQHQRKDASI
jgi:hypothetical protein